MYFSSRIASEELFRIINIVGASHLRKNMSSNQEEQNQGQPVIKEGDGIEPNSKANETMTKSNNEISKTDEKLSPKLEVVIKSNPAIEQSISKIKEEVEELFSDPKKEVTSNKSATTKCDGGKAKPLENLNNLLADDKVRAMVNMIGGKEAHGILVETLSATNSSKSIQEKQTAIINGVRKFQSLDNDSVVDISKHLFGFTKPYKK